MDGVVSVGYPIMVVGVVMLYGGRPTRVSKELPPLQARHCLRKAVV
jgi:hypothetical protein